MLMHGRERLAAHQAQFGLVLPQRAAARHPSLCVWYPQ